MAGCESENCTDTQTSTLTSITLGVDLSATGNSGDTVLAPIVKMEPDGPTSDINIEDVTPELSNETIRIKPEPSENADINTTVVKLELPCDSQECASGGAADGDLHSLGKSTCGTQTTTTATNSFIFGSNQHCFGESVFSTAQMATAAPDSLTFRNSQYHSRGPAYNSVYTTSTTNGFVLVNQRHSAGPVFTTPQMTTAASNSFTFRNSQHCSGGPVFSTPQMCTATSSTYTFGNSRHFSRQSNSGITTEHNSLITSRAATTDSSDFTFNVSLSADTLSNHPAALFSQTAVTAPCCSCFSFFSSPRCKCSHHLPQPSGEFPFGSALQRHQTKTSDSSQQPSTLPNIAVTTATVSSSLPCFSTCFDSNQQHVWGKRLFPAIPKAVSSASEMERTNASSQIVHCLNASVHRLVTSMPQTKLCFGVPGMKLPITTTETDNHQQPTTGSPSSSTATVSSGGQHPRPLYTNRRKRKNQGGYEFKGNTKHIRESSDRYNLRKRSEERSFRRDATDVSQETGEDRISHLERPLNLSASDSKVVIIPVDYPDTRLSEDNYIELQLALIEEMFSSKEKSLPQFSTCSFEGGALVLKCKTDNAKDWLVAILPNLKSWKGANLKVGDYKDYLFSTRVSLRTPPAMTTRSPHSILHLIKKQNKDLDTDQWKILNSLEQEIGQFLHLSLDPAAIQDLKNRGCNIFLGLEQILVKIYDR